MKLVFKYLYEFRTLECTIPIILYFNTRIVLLSIFVRIYLPIDKICYKTQQQYNV
jgi:hypothetical protein